MYIALFFPSFRGGGAEHVMMQLGRYFVDKGYQVDIVVLDDTGAYKKRSTLLDGVRVVSLENKRAILSIPKLIAYAHKHKPDVILSTLDHINIVTAIALMFVRKDIRHYVRIANTITRSYQRFSVVKRMVTFLAIRLFYPRVSGVIAVSNGVADDISTVVPLDNITVIPNPIDHTAITLLSRGVDVLPKRISGRKRIVSVGRLVEQKNFSLLINAIVLLLQKGRDIELYIIGEGKKRDELEKLIKDHGLSDRVFLFGFVDNPIACVKGADCFVLSSNWEGMPNTLLEALALGVPIVSTDCPSGPKEIIDNPALGLLVPMEDVLSMATALEAQLYHFNGDHDLMRQRSQQFAITNIGDRYLKTLGV